MKRYIKSSSTSLDRTGSDLYHGIINTDLVSKIESINDDRLNELINHAADIAVTDCPDDVYPEDDLSPYFKDEEEVSKIRDNHDGTVDISIFVVLYWKSKSIYKTRITYRLNLNSNEYKLIDDEVLN